MAGAMVEGEAVDGARVLPIVVDEGATMRGDVVEGDPVLSVVVASAPSDSLTLMSAQLRNSSPLHCTDVSPHPPHKPPHQA